MGTPAKPIELDAVFDDPSAVLRLVERHGPHRGISPSLVNVGFDRRRKNRACSNADRTRSVVFDIDARQPRMRREYTSVTKLTYTNPTIVQT